MQKKKTEEVKGLLTDSEREMKRRGEVKIRLGLNRECENGGWSAGSSGGGRKEGPKGAQAKGRKEGKVWMKAEKPQLVKKGGGWNSISALQLGRLGELRPWALSLS